MRTLYPALASYLLCLMIALGVGWPLWFAAIPLALWAIGGVYVVTVVVMSAVLTAIVVVNAAARGCAGRTRP